MSITNENNERDLSLKAIRRLISSNEAPAARVILEEIVSAGGLFGITLQDATRLLEYLEGSLGSDGSPGSLIYAAAEQQLDGASLDDTVPVLRGKGIGREDIQRLVENIILAQEDDQLRQKMGEVAAMLGSKHSLRQIEPGADFAQINDGRVVAPEGEDKGAVIYQTGGGKRVQLAMLDDGEFILSKAGVVGLGLEDGASLSDAHARGFKVLFDLHDKARARGREALSEADDLSTAEPTPSRKTVEQEKPELTKDISPADLLAEAQIIDEQGRAAVTDETGRWHASDELINAVIAAESGGDPSAVSPTGAIGIMQILPSTAADPGWGVQGLEGSEQEIIEQLRDPEINKRLGTDYLNVMLNRYEGNTELALAAYNQGAGKLDKVVGSDQPLQKFARDFEREAEEALPYIEKVLSYVRG